MYVEAIQQQKEVKLVSRSTHTSRRLRFLPKHPAEQLLQPPLERLIFRPLIEFTNEVATRSQRFTRKLQRGVAKVLSQESVTHSLSLSIDKAFLSYAAMQACPADGVMDMRFGVEYAPCSRRDRETLLHWYSSTYGTGWSTYSTCIRKFGPKVLTCHLARPSKH